MFSHNNDDDGDGDGGGGGGDNDDDDDDNNNNNCISDVYTSFHQYSNVTESWQPNDATRRGFHGSANCSTNLVVCTLT